MRNCKTYRIYKFNYATPMNTPKQNAENWKRAREFNDFKHKLIDSFNRENYMELFKYTYYAQKERIPYKKEWLSSPLEVGFDMLEEDRGLYTEHQWGKLYMAVPLTQVEMLEFFEQNKPLWVTNVKKI